MDIFLFVLGYLLQCAASWLLVYKIHKHKSIYGLSTDTLVLFFMANIARCIWTLDTRLVETFLAYMELALSTVANCILIYFCYKYKHTTTQQAILPLSVMSLAPLALILGFFFNPADDWFTVQILVAFTMYVEALGLLPQLYLMKKMHEIEPLTSHYVGLIMIARICRMVFWGVLFWMGEHFLQLFVADILHTIFAADYLYLWIGRLKGGGPLMYSL